MTQNQTSAEALVTMFASNDLPGDTPATRLNVILNATGSDSYLHFAIPYDDSGFPESLQDGSLWLSSSNQVGHFLTATDMAYSSSNESSDQFFLTLITGHEMSGDASYNTGSAANIKQIMLGASHPDAPSLFLQGGDETFGKILSEGDFSGDRTGNSMPDLRLSRLGWDFGKLTQLGAFASTDQQALFLRLSLGLYP